MTKKLSKQQPRIEIATDCYGRGILRVLDSEGDLVNSFSLCKQNIGHAIRALAQEVSRVTGMVCVVGD